MWLSWWSGCFQYQGSAVRIQLSAIILFILIICLWSTVYWKDENKEKEAGIGPFFLKKKHLFLLPRNDIAVSNYASSMKWNKTSHVTSFNLKDFVLRFNVVFLNGPNPASFYLFSSFQTHITILQQINVKNVHTVYSAGIQTHDIWTRFSSHNH